MTTKIPFDVEKWKSGKYDVVTRDGEQIHSLYIHDVEIDMPISFYCYDSDVIECCTRHGNFHKDRRESLYDLFLTPKKRKVWIGIDSSEYSHTRMDTTCAFTSKQSLLESIDAADPWHIIEVELPCENI